MCYSAQITADYRKYVHVYGADIDIDEFFRLFWNRRSGSKSKIPKAMETPVLLPQNDAEARIKEAIVEFSAEQTAKLEQDLFKKRTRLADAERSLLTKSTEAATESKRIATDKIDWIRGKLEDFCQTTQSRPRSVLKSSIFRFSRRCGQRHESKA